jgi:lipopolysaccharide biosynthesis regulator YciM
MPELFWLLLPVAALGGWVAAGRYRGARRPRRDDRLLGPGYFTGIDHLLNERPDKAIELFIRMLEVTADTFETHLALGSLFRRRGEVDRAIRIHQNLVAREALTTEQRTHARLELGRDYLRAGLLDRAEGVLKDLVADPGVRPQVLELLLDIYQQEKDWDGALAVAGQLEAAGGEPARALHAQFLCEQALQAIADERPLAARACLERALAADAGCARASIILGDLLREAGDSQAALACYERVEQQDADRLPEVLEAMAECYRRQGRTDRMIDYLDGLVARHEGITPVLLQAELLAAELGAPAAVDFLVDQFRKRPSVHGLARLIDLGLVGTGSHEAVVLQGLRKLADNLRDTAARYSCSSCSFSGKSLHWQCPGCRRWDTVRPVKAAPGK